MTDVRLEVRSARSVPELQALMPEGEEPEPWTMQQLRAAMRVKTRREMSALLSKLESGAFIGICRGQAFVIRAPREGRGVTLDRQLRRDPTFLKDVEQVWQVAVIDLWVDASPQTGVLT